MATNTVRSVVIFSVIAIGFIGIAAGGMFFLKSRNHTLATAHSHQAPQQQTQAAADQTKQEAAKTEESKPDTSAAKNEDKKTEEKPAAAPAQQTTSTPAPAPDNKSATDQSTPATPTAVPATGPSLPGMIATTILMMAAAFFGSQLLRARSAYRRHLEG